MKGAHSRAATAPGASGGTRRVKKLVSAAALKRASERVEEPVPKKAKSTDVADKGKAPVAVSSEKEEAKDTVLEFNWEEKMGKINYNYDPAPAELGSSSVALQLGRAIYSHSLYCCLKKIPSVDLPATTMQSMATAWQTTYELTCRAKFLEEEIRKTQNEYAEVMAAKDAVEASLASLQEQNKKLANEFSRLKMKMVKKDAVLAEKDVALEEAKAQIVELAAELTAAREQPTMTSTSPSEPPEFRQRLITSFREGVASALEKLVGYGKLPSGWTTEKFNRFVGNQGVEVESSNTDNRSSSGDSGSDSNNGRSEADNSNKVGQ